MKLLFWINKGIVYARLTVHGKRAEVSTGIHTTNLTSQRTGDDLKDTELSSIEFKLRQAYLALSLAIEPFDVLDVKQAYNKSIVSEAPPRLLDIMLTKDRVYLATITHLKTFLKGTNPKLSDLDQRFADKFVAYLQGTSSPSSSKVYFSKVIASVGAVLSEVPFKMPKIDLSGSDKVKYLTVDEHAKLLAMPKTLELELFLWQCETGMAMSNMNEFDGALETTIKGDKLLRYTRGKTGVEAIIPATAKIIELAKLFPLVSPLKERAYNKALGVIGSSLSRDLTSHMGRHTCAVLRLIDGYSMESVKAIMGHSSIRTTEKFYAKVTVEKLFKEQKEIRHGH